MLRATSYLTRVFILVTAIAVCGKCGADDVDDYIRLEMQKRHIPGLALAVVKDGKSAKLQGYGVANLELQSPVTPDTVFELASVTKQFTAAAIMLLAQEGKLNLEDTLGKLLKGTPDSLSGITIRRLLSHTSGLPREAPLGSGRSYRDDISEDEMWRGARRLRPQYEPGDRFSYSNLGFNLLGLVIERRSGKSYSDFMQSRIFGPLGMTSTRVNDLRTVITNRASGYYWENGAFRNGEPTSPSTYSSSGSIVSTAADLEKWDAALSSDWLLSVKSRMQMWTPVTLNNNKTVGYGFGWSIGDTRGHHSVSHDGLLSGFRSYIIRYTDDHLSVILLTNQSSLEDPERIARGVAQRFIPSLKPDQPKQVVGEPKLIPTYTGRYEFANNVMLTVTIENGQLAAHLPAASSDSYRPISDTAFYCYDEDIQLTFVKDDGEFVNAVKVKQDGTEHAALRIGPLVHQITAQPDPDPLLSARVRTALEALATGGLALAKVPGVTRGVRKDFIEEQAFRDLRSITYIGTENVADRKLERHGSKVARVNTYRFVTGNASKYVLIYLTQDNLVTDEDVVDD